MTMNRRIWVLGANDPEMASIEELLREVGEEYIYALDENGQRVHPGNAYRCPTPEVTEEARVYAVECIDVLPEGWVRIDHHRPGDPGHGRPPEDFMAASSIGQVISELARLGRLPMGLPVGSYEWVGDWEGKQRAASRWFHWEAEARTAFSGGTLFERFQAPYRLAPCDGYYIFTRRVSGIAEFAASPDEMRGAGAVRVAPDKIVRVHIPHDLVLAAAADHCLAAAYRGECPGVDPDDLVRWRVERRAAFQGRPPKDILADVELAREALREAPFVELSAPLVYAHAVVRDLRGRDVPELPEAAAREGASYLATVTERDGRKKVVLGGHTTPDVVRAFMTEWAPARGLVDVYGDPARGFAGAYVVEECNKVY